jgi:hypothetical protein
MASRAFEATLEDTKHKLWVWWAVAVATVPLFCAYGFFISADEVPMHLPTWYQVALGGAVLVMGGMSVGVPRYMMSNRALMEHVRGKKKEEPPGRTSQVNEKYLPREERLVTLLESYKRPFVMGLVLGAMVTLLGVVYVLLSAQREPMIGLMVLSLALHALNRPTIDKLTQRAAKYLPAERADAPTAWPTQQQQEW